MRKSTNARKSAERKLIETYRTDVIGIPIVLHHSVWEERVPEEEEPRVVIPDLEGLIAAAAIARIKCPFKLSGREIKFLRKALGISGKELAKKLNVAKETVSRWENAKEPVGPMAERLLRIYVGLKLQTDAPAVQFDPEDVMMMEVQSVRRADATLVMHFSRVNVDQWEEADKKAA